MEPMRVRDLMSTGVIALRVGDTLQRADLEMKFAKIRHLPVLDEHGRVLGILSDRDLLRAFGASDEKTLPVTSVMTTQVITVSAGEPAAHAAEMLLENKIGALPVLDEADRVVGIISAADFLRVAAIALNSPSACLTPELSAEEELRTS
jgi:CBS domain-containing protein